MIFAASMGASIDMIRNRMILTSKLISENVPTALAAAAVNPGSRSQKLDGPKHG